jgi:hypothetical protein
MAAGLYWKWTIQRGRAYARSLGRDYLEISYEDLVLKPRETLAKLSIFLKHDLDYERIQRMAIGALQRPPTSFAKELETGEFNPVNRWKHVFTPAQLTLFESLTGDLLEMLGYPLETPKNELDDSLRVRRMCALYPMYFDLKDWLKKHSTCSRYFVNYDEILVDK